MQNTKSELTSTHTPFFVEGIEWDFSSDDPEVEYDGDDYDLPDNVIVWLDKDNIEDVEDEDGECDEGELISMILDKITDDLGWCIDDIGSWREIDPSEVEALLAA